MTPSTVTLAMIRLRVAQVMTLFMVIMVMTRLMVA